MAYKRVVHGLLYLYVANFAEIDFTPTMANTRRIYRHESVHELDGVHGAQKMFGHVLL